MKRSVSVIVFAIMLAFTSLSYACVIPAEILVKVKASIAEVTTGLDWSACVTALATIVLAIVTFWYARLTKKILDAQSDPCVVLSVVHDEDRATIFQLIARNVGKGIAHDIRFEFSRPLPSEAFGITKAKTKKASEMTAGPLINGIPALVPGECRKVDWGQYKGLMDAVGDSPIIATCRFKKGRKEMPPVQCSLDVASFTETAGDQSLSARMIEELKKMSKNIGDLCKGIQKLQIEVTSMPTKSDDGKGA